MTDISKQEQGLSGLDAKKRETLRRLGLGAAFVVPVVTSVALDGMTISKVQAAAPAGSDVRKRKKKEEDKCQPLPSEIGAECTPDCGCEGNLTCELQGKPVDEDYRCEADID